MYIIHNDILSQLYHTNFYRGYIINSPFFLRQISRKISMEFQVRELHTLLVAFLERGAVWKNRVFMDMPEIYFKRDLRLVFFWFSTNYLGFQPREVLEDIS